MLGFMILTIGIIGLCLFVPSSMERKPLEHQNVFLSGEKFSSLFQRKSKY